MYYHVNFDLFNSNCHWDNDDNIATNKHIYYLYLSRFKHKLFGANMPDYVK